MLLGAIVAAPGAVFLLLSAGWLAGWLPPERGLNRITSALYVTLTGLALALAGEMFATGGEAVTLSLGHWFRVASYEFPLALLCDRLSLPLVLLTVILTGLIGAFSFRYLHRDRGFHRFFVLLHLFCFGALLIFTAASLDLLVCGWELLGISSVLLISYFEDRPEPVKGAMRVFGIYRASGVGLLAAVVLLHHTEGSALYADVFSPPFLMPAGVTLAAGMALLIAAVGKSAQVPFSGWLPRAMEGPTPSSAIFYGAISVHAGAYLLLRARPLLEQSTPVLVAVVVVGLLTAIHATMVGRACADAKTSLAYAAVAQLGVIFVEIGLGWQWLALAHICGHAAVRTLQFLRAPSMLHDFHLIHAGAGGELRPTGLHLEALLPRAMKPWLYRLALDRGHHDTVLDLMLRALSGLSAALGRMERRWMPGTVDEPPPAEHRGVARRGRWDAATRGASR